MSAALLTPGGDLDMGVTGGAVLESSQNALTAKASGTQANGTQISAQTTRFTIVATNADSAVLPPARQGLEVTVVNSGAKAMQVFGAGTDTINDVATATGIVQMPNSVNIYVCPIGGTAGKWYCEGTGSGFSGSLPTFLFQDAVTANVTQTQAAATQITGAVARVSVCATQGNGVALPASAAGLEITLINAGAQAMQVYGNNAAADTINGIATATGISHGVGQIATYYCTVAGNWLVQFGQPQQAGLVTLGADAAIPPHVAHTYVVTKGTAAALTLAAPTATTDDGLTIIVTSNTAAAHAITATGLLQCGTAAVNLATFAAQKGAGLTLMAYQGKWNVLSSVGITFS